MGKQRWGSEGNWGWAQSCPGNHILTNDKEERAQRVLEQRKLQNSLLIIERKKKKTRHGCRAGLWREDWEKDMINLGDIFVEEETWPFQ